VMLVFLAALLLPAESFAAAGEISGVSVSTGYRRDSLDWNIADYDHAPDVLSELQWRGLNIFQLKGEVAGVNAKRIYARVSADYGWVISGENQDSDYAGSGRSLEFSRSNNGVDGSNVWDVNIALGYEIPFGRKQQHHFYPVVGYSYFTQNLRMTDGKQTLWNQANALLYDPSAVPQATGPFPGLRSRYDAVWSGPWVGTDVTWNFHAQGMVVARLEAHYAWYEAKADWNLRPEFDHPVSFEHKAVGRGLLLELGWRGQPTGRWVWGVNFTYQRWTTDAGTDRTYLVDPCYCYAEGDLNEVNWSSMGLNLTLRKEL
jgi:hypothetical protein